MSGLCRLGLAALLASAVALNAGGARAVESSIPEPTVTTNYNPDQARTMREIESKVRVSRKAGWSLPMGDATATVAQVASQGWNYCALTFDDGPHPTITRQVLDILAAEHVHATYFPVGRLARVHPDLIRDYVAAGHEIGNHSLRHPDFRHLTLEEQKAEITESSRILRELGAPPRLFRPPYGRFTPETIAMARQAGLRTILWTVDTRDWQFRNAPQVEAMVERSIAPASIVLMHATLEATVTALPHVIAIMRRHGCKFVTASEWVDFMRGEPQIRTADANPASGPVPGTGSALPAAADAKPINPLAALVPAPAATPTPTHAPPAPAQKAARPAPAPHGGGKQPPVQVASGTATPADSGPAVRLSGDVVSVRLGPNSDPEGIATDLRAAMDRFWGR